MSSGKIGMVLTYKNINISKTQTQTQTQTRSQAITIPSNIPRINRFINTSSMHTIIHTPAKGCSSCGS